MVNTWINRVQKVSIPMLAPCLPTCFSIIWNTCMVWRDMPFEKIKIVAIGAKLDIRIEWFEQFWMSMLPLSLKPSLDSIWRRDGKRWSLKDIKMATYFIFQWNRYSIYECPWCPRIFRFITFLHLTPGVSPFFLTTVSKGWFHVGKEAEFGDNVSKMLLMEIKYHYNTIMMRAWL